MPDTAWPRSLDTKINSLSHKDAILSAYAVCRPHSNASRFHCTTSSGRRDQRRSPTNDVSACRNDDREKPNADDSGVFAAALELIETLKSGDKEVPPNFKVGWKYLREFTKSSRHQRYIQDVSGQHIRFADFGPNFATYGIEETDLSEAERQVRRQSCRLEGRR